MYNVLLVDDERIILEGISQIIDWSALSLNLAGTAKNGLEALDFIRANKPDIVITDIRMPGLDGLGLVEQTRAADLPVSFIMLSGFSDFDYARQAMRFGVRHYLLKPCNEQAIIGALAEVKQELAERRDRERFLQRMETEMKRMLPHARQQFLKEFVTNKTYGKRDWEEYRALLGIPPENRNVRLLLFQLEGGYDFEHLFALQNIAEEWFGKGRLLLGTTIGSHVLLLIGDEDGEERLFEAVEQIKATYRRFYNLDMTVALSSAGDISGARAMYRETLECLNHRFYLGEGSLITLKDVAAAEGAEPAAEAVPPELPFDEDKLGLTVKAGHLEAAVQQLRELFGALAEARADAAYAKSCVISAYMTIIRQAPPDRMNGYLNDLAVIERTETLQALEEFLTGAVREIAALNYRMTKNKHSAVVAKVIESVHSNLSNPELSLHWVARELLYMNADYLGKLFKKEVGEKFSNYVMRLRMEKAIELIGASSDVKVFELAEMLGFGDNPQYFSQVFKRYTGYSPSEFKRAP